MNHNPAPSPWGEGWGDFGRCVYVGDYLRGLSGEGEYAEGECDTCEITPHPALSWRRGFGILQNMKILLFISAILDIGYESQSSSLSLRRGLGWGDFGRCICVGNYLRGLFGEGKYAEGKCDGGEVSDLWLVIGD